MICSRCWENILPGEETVTNMGRNYHEECWAEVELDLADQDR